MSGHQVTLYIYKPDLESPYAALMRAICSMKQHTSTHEDLNETIPANFSQNRTLQTQLPFPKGDM
jgi:hypothetical protein